MGFVETKEERREQCAIASKLVTVKIRRRKPSQEPSGDGEIIDFDCSGSSSSCEYRCTYRMLLDDF